jgi:hypothetical protein
LKLMDRGGMSCLAAARAITADFHGAK